MTVVTGRDGLCRVEYPFGKVFAAANRDSHSSDWLGLDQELEMTLICDSE